MNPTPPSQRRAALCHALVAVLLAISAGEAWLLLHGHALNGNDFRHLWLGAYLLHFGRDPYDAELLRRTAANFGMPRVNPFVYLPTTGLLLRPLVAFNFAAAQLDWFGVCWAGAWLTVLLGPSWMRLRHAAAARLAGAAFLAAAMPFWRDLTAGQMNVPTAALLTFAAGALVRDQMSLGRRRGDLFAGAALAIGFAWKIAPALPLLALWPLRRRRACVMGAIVACALLAVSLRLYGWPIHRDALQLTQQMRYGASTWSDLGQDFYRAPFNQSINSLLHHLLTHYHRDDGIDSRPWIDWGPKAANLLTLAAALALIALWLAAWQRWRRGERGQSDEAGLLRLFLAMTLLMLLLPSLMWDHYLVQMLPAWLWLVGSGRALRNIGSAALALAIFAAAVVPLAASAPDLAAGPGILLMSLRLWPLLVLYGWLLRADPSPAILK